MTFRLDLPPSAWNAAKTINASWIKPYHKAPDEPKPAVIEPLVHESDIDTENLFEPEEDTDSVHLMPSPPPAPEPVVVVPAPNAAHGPVAHREPRRSSRPSEKGPSQSRRSISVPSSSANETHWDPLVPSDTECRPPVLKKHLRTLSCDPCRVIITEDALPTLPTLRLLVEETIFGAL